MGARRKVILFSSLDPVLSPSTERFPSRLSLLEDPDVEGFFDCRLRSDPATARNAIRLLARVGFPDEVVASAMVYVTRQGRV